ncbi:MAG TPA: hypothetical protein ACFYEF_08935 [Candidatus Wunengus sp. YC63]|uniref:hypothetical protein n=1 Tax=unclassified Candidatus Wunengus TaxID=3367695 RepID=UPI004029AAF5
MNTSWHQTFRDRMNQFERQYRPSHEATAVSIKVRVTSGCFHREHSPHAYKLIDKYITKIKEHDEFSFEEHESGPELLVYIAAAAAGISLAKSIIDLVVAILKARSEGIKKGDNPVAPLELIVRSVHKDGEFKEETILRIGHQETINQETIEKHLKKSISDLLKEGNKETANKLLKRDTAKKQKRKGSNLSK